MSNFEKLVRARMEKTGENWQTAQRAIRAQAPPPSTVERLVVAPIYILEQVDEAARTLFGRRVETPRFTLGVHSRKADGRDEIRPGREAPMVPLVDITFVRKPPSTWGFTGRLAFIVGELYDGNEPVGAELLDTKDGRERLGAIIVQHVRSGQPWLAERLTSLTVTSGELRENLLVDVALTMADPIDVLVEELASFHVSSILMRRISSSAGRSVAHMRELADNPKYFAESASVQRTITNDERVALLRRGATEEQTTQKIRVFAPEQRTTFSVPCASCHRWIYCGHEEHVGACKCGQEYVISFDGPVDWSLPQGWLCMDCGEPFEVVIAGDPRNPWHHVNARQQACDVCFHMEHVGAWWVRKRAEERGRPRNGS